MSSIQTIAVIGGGAAGMMCAATIIEQCEEKGEGQPQVLLFEKNKRLGAKVIISGGGRCNVTTGIFRRKELLQHYTRGAGFLDHIFRVFGPKKVRRWFESHGVALKQEADGRIFPVSDDGQDIVGVFEQLFGGGKVDLRFGETVDAMQVQDQGEGKKFVLTSKQGEYRCDAVVVATGGQAYAHTGSSGDGYSFARVAGHTITPLGPSLNSFLCQEEWVHGCSGISLPDACFRVRDSRIPGSGPVLLTHFGISGPHTFVLASHRAFDPITKQTPLLIKLQPRTEMDRETWDVRCKQAMIAHPKRQLLTLLSSQLPKRFVEQVLLAHGVAPAMMISQLSKVDRQRLCALLGDGIPLTLVGRRPGDEFVTAGGVVTDEIDPTTMESTLVSGLYFVGEVVDVDGVTGGYNLQASWAMGRVAGEAICYS